ncbi:MAG: hypothetical protein IJT97_03840 [Bacteroidaceae bacterium]|nr:hypothetical protein [Bacteroidaceae bacterium]
MAIHFVTTYRLPKGRLVPFAFAHPSHCATPNGVAVWLATLIMSRWDISAAGVAQWLATLIMSRWDIQWAAFSPPCY